MSMPREDLGRAESREFEASLKDTTGGADPSKATIEAEAIAVVVSEAGNGHMLRPATAWSRKWAVEAGLYHASRRSLSKSERMSPVLATYTAGFCARTACEPNA